MAFINGKEILSTYINNKQNLFGVKANVETPLPERIDGALTFSSPNSFTLNTYNNTKNWDGELEYSTDTNTWNVWDGTTTLSADGGKLYVRGTGNTYITSGGGDKGSFYGDTSNWVLSGSEISCCGNIENLLDYATVAKGEHPTMSDYCYAKMFYDCTSLTTAPELPATTLAGSCYYYMFSGCTSLTTAPELPATTLAGSCYYYMFSGCTSLTTAPELPATTLAGSCYYRMFDSCTSLTTAPELPATTLAWYCYYEMFRHCTSLTTAPELPATTLARYCYLGMFAGCTSLTTAPELPATTLADSCYYCMFSGCTSLTTAPELPATTLADACYYYMFRNCTSLTTAPELPATFLEWKCYYEMFDGCTKIKMSTAKTGEYQTPYRIPTSGTGTTEYDNALTNMFINTGGTFKGTPSINRTYYTSNTVV